ncbi:hypothetical protein CASFOL_008516 [Castilleja foliolosa]|uniref:Tyrosinase copper-binding domain-containing protein n=1 Tax=Castilleja foliolosa TaxID=1961234 RepID=A0ABD3DZ56_9LAMI
MSHSILAPTNCSFKPTSLPYTTKTLYIACQSKSSNTDKNQTPEPKLDRRGFLLVGFGSSGIYNTTVSNIKKLSPDFLNCVDSQKPDGHPINCCNPTTPITEITDFTPPNPTTTPVRVAAQSLEGAITLTKYEKAIELMKNLPTDDPRNFTRQANVHCAYCDGGYNQSGFPDRKFEIHQSWLFFPFHRWYIYFFERICRKLLEDDTFALPFWNYDSPSGMEIPAMFNISDSPLFDPKRDQSHLPPSVVDLTFGGLTTGLISPRKQRNYNLNVMYKQMISNGSTPKLFMGQPFRPGDDITKMYGAGSIEIAPHNTVHVWTGDGREIFRENMGVFYSAARDPIFYTHHANIDRLWDVWVNKLKGKVFNDPDWLETSFVFYDEEKKAVRVKVKDCLDLSRLGYTYQEVEDVWLDAKPKPRRLGKRAIRVSCDGECVFPKMLDGVLNVVVKRRPGNGTEKTEEEVLVIEGIMYGGDEHVVFDVYVNEENVDLCTPENVEMLGSFVSVPHGGRDMGVMRSSMRFGLSSVVAELGVEEEEVVVVTLVRRRGVVTVGGVRIEFDA